MSSRTDQRIPRPRADQSAAARVEQLYESHSRLVRSICNSLLSNAVDAEDAVQQTFLSAQRALLNGSSPRDAAAWLATIARHESFARARARMREPLPTDGDVEATGPDAQAVAVHRQEVRDLHKALAELPTQQREAILLREMRGLSYEEVASTLSVSTSAVESLLFRARRNLRAKLQGSLTLFPPGGLVRELAARLGSGFAVPAATKAIAVGAGAAVLAGGVVVGPRIVGLGHAPQPRPAASGHEVRSAPSGMKPGLPARSSGDRLRAARPAGEAPAQHETRHRSSGGDAASSTASSDQNELPSHGGPDGSGDSSSMSNRGSSASATDGGGTSSGDTQTTSPENSTTTDSGSQTTEAQSTTETTTPTSGSDGAGG